MLRAISAAALLAAALVGAGCGDSGPSFVPLSGKVTLNGAPLSPKPNETAFVEFFADKTAGNASAHLPRGTIQPDGTYVVSTAGQPGIEAGKWLARVVYQKEPTDDKNRYAPPKALVPAKFSDFTKSGFAVTAGPDAPQAPDFAVVTK